MLKKYMSIVSLVMFLSLTLLNSGCDSDGPAENTGEKIDQSYENTKDAVEDSADKINGEGPAENAGEEIDEAAEDVEESVEPNN